MEENNHSTALKWAVGIFITLGVISFGVFLFNKSKPAIEKAGGQLDTITAQMENSEFNNYNGKSVSGSEVISVINTKASNNVTIKVITKSNTAGKSYNTASYNIDDVNNNDYIEPTGKFAGSLDSTTNGTVNTIIFTQE